MNVRTMIDEAVQTLEDGPPRQRIRAAMRLGARLALESVIAKGGYLSDAKEVLAELDGKDVASPAPAAPEPEPAL